MKFSQRSLGVKALVKSAETERIDRTMSKDTGEFIISKSMNLRLPPIFGYISFSFIPRQVRFSQSLSHIYFLNFNESRLLVSFASLAELIVCLWLMLKRL